jgi:hypothetical protein
MFLHDLGSRLVDRIQLSTDGHGAYLEAVPHAFGNDVDFAQMVKIYRETSVAPGRYSPADCVVCKTKVIEGNPDPAHISTSHAERAELDNADEHASVHEVNERV